MQYGLKMAGAIAFLVAFPTISFGETSRSLTTVAELMQNAKMAGDECLLLKKDSASAEAMQKLFGMNDARMFPANGPVGPAVQVRSGNFLDNLPKPPKGRSDQVVGEFTSESAWLSFDFAPVLDVDLQNVEGTLGTTLSFVKLPPPPGQFEGTPPDQSYYLLEGRNLLCHHRLTFHFFKGHLDRIGLQVGRL